MFIKKINLVKKPWGYYINLYNDKKINIKMISVNPNSRLSLQFHQKRDERWILVKGTGYCQIKEDKIMKMKKDKVYQIAKKEKHRLFGGEKGCCIVEICSGKFLERDIIRIEDDYGRIK